MIEDKELDNLAKTVEQNSNLQVVEKEKKSIAPEVVIETQFSKKMDDVKQEVLNNAAVEDQSFITTVKENVKEAAVTLTKVEKKKAEFQEHQVDAKDEELDTARKKNKHIQDENYWENRKKKREYHFDGVKPIMNFVGIETPMNLIFLYVLAIILSPLFIISKLCKGSFGALLSGANDAERSKGAKGFLWTLLCVFSLLLIMCLIYLFLKTQGIDLLAKIKNI